MVILKYYCIYSVRNFFCLFGPINWNKDQKIMNYQNCNNFNDSRYWKELSLVQLKLVYLGWSEMKSDLKLGCSMLTSLYVQIFKSMPTCK